MSDSDSDKQTAFTLMVQIIEQRGQNCETQFDEAVALFRKIGDGDRELGTPCVKIIGYLEGLVYADSDGDASVLNTLEAVKTAVVNVFSCTVNYRSNNITVPAGASAETIAKAIENSKSAHGINIHSNNVFIQAGVSGSEPSEPKNEISNVGPYDIVRKRYDEIFKFMDEISKKRS